MDAERWRQVRALFDLAADTPEEGWARILETACPNDAELHQHALDLLKADRLAGTGNSHLVGQAPDLLNEVAEAAETQRTDAWIGCQLGAWRIQRSIGRGGMGLVYLAERDDGQYRQRAALKLLRGNDGSEAALQRFVAERQILASLEHPNIARLLDGGCTDESGPWFALEYIDGVALTAWCDARRLNVRERLRLFLDVCAAVSYAHEHLVVHRDLKPANILVNAEGQVKLLDFGIAKLLDVNSAQTGTALRAFTPEYAAPEQIRGEVITTAVDVYALGVVLYELMTGQRPYRISHASAAAYERAVLEQEAARPSSQVTRGTKATLANGFDRDKLADCRNSTPAALRARLHGDLDAIVLKALRKDVASRYGSVRELAEDIRATMTHRPVLARRGGLRYRAGRFMRRNGLAVAMAGLAAVALMIGLIAALWQAREARIQRDSARQSLAFMTELFQSADPGMLDRTGLTVRDLLDEGVRNIRFAFTKADYARADLLLAMASAYLGLYLTEPAEPLIDEAMRIAREGEDAIKTAETLLVRCDLLTLQGKRAECADHTHEIERLIMAIDTPEENKTLATALDYRAMYLSDTDQYDLSAETARRALALLTSVPENLRLRSNISGTLAFSLTQAGRPQEAVQVIEPFLAELRVLEHAPPRVLADTLDNLASAYGHIGRIDESLDLQREGLMVMEQLYGANNPVIVTKLGNLSVALQRSGKLMEALALMERNVAIRRAHPTLRNHPSFANSLGNLGTLAFMVGRDDEAIAHLDEAITLSEVSNEATPRHLGIALWWRAAVRLATGQLEAAATDVARSRGLFAALHEANHPRLLRSNALALAIAIAKEGEPALTPRTCLEVEQLVEAYSGTAIASRTDSEVAFALFLRDLCLTSGNGVPRGDVMSAPDDPLARLAEKLEPDDFRLRHARLIHATWQGTSK